MTYAARATGSIDRIARHFGAGDTITVRRHHSLIDPAGGVISALSVNGLAAAGAASIDLDSTRLQGSTVTGLTFTVDNPNRLLQTDDPTSSPWATFNVTVELRAAEVNPLGGTGDVYRITPTVTAGYLHQAATSYTASVDDVASVWLRRETGGSGVGTGRVRFSDGVSQTNSSNFDSETWTQVSAPRTMDAGATQAQIRIQADFSGTLQPMLIWHPQVEYGTAATAYHPNGAALDTTEYTTTNAVTAASNGLASVAFTPVLTQAAYDDQGVTLGTHYVDYSFLKSKRSFMDRDIGDTIDASDRKLIVSALGQSVVPNDDDQILEHGEVLNVVNVRPYKPGDTEAGYVIWVKG